MKAKIIYLILFALFLLPFVSAATTHCLRADVNREISPDLNLIKLGSFATTSSDYNYILPVGSTIDYAGFGSYNVYCDDGVNGSTRNYVDLFDTTTGIIIATNVTNNSGSLVPYGGPIDATGPMCSNGPDNPCVIMNGQYVPVRGACGISLSMGMGGTDSIVFPLNADMFGPHNLQLRLGAVSPGGVDKYNPVIWPTPKRSINIFVGTPNLLVFGQQGLKRLNYYETSGTAQETALFSISNKSKYIEVIDNYKVNCTEDTNCVLDMVAAPIDPSYRFVNSENWYLGASGQSCVEVCNSHRGTTSSTINYAGASNANCSVVSNAFGLGDARDINQTSITTYDGLGCFLGQQRTLRIANRTPTQDAEYDGDKRFCSCQNAPAPLPPQLQYKGFRLMPGESMVIPARVTIDKTKTPYSFFSSLDLNFYVMKDATQAITGSNGNKLIYSTHSTQTKVEAGLLDKQDFQISVIKNPVQRECISDEGEAGVTGEEYAPKVNLYFGSNSPPGSASGSTVLISKDECTKTSASDNNWVYCSQREFLIALAERINAASNELVIAQNNETDNNQYGAQIHRANALELLNFDAYIRAQSITPQGITSSVNAISEQLFSSTGLVRMNMGEFRNLNTAIKFRKTINGTEIEDTDIEPGLYYIVVNAPDLGFGLFKRDSANSVVDGLNVTVSMEKKEDPTFDWFFYYDKNTDDFPTKIASVPNPSMYTTNVDARGTILTFEKGADITGQFYKTVAIPIIAKISDKNGTGSTPNFKVPGHEADTFTYWTGFASNEPNKAGIVDGCTNPFTQKVLPYRVTDERIATSGNFIINDAVGTKQNGVMYLQTVVYVPTLSGQLTISDAEFGLKWLGYNCDGNSVNRCGATITNIVGNYPDTKVETLNEVFNGIKNGSICVYQDDSLSNPRWKVFWNQDKVLQKLDANRNEITDANMCATRQIFSS